MQRLNGVIGALLEKRTVFSTVPVTNGNFSEFSALAKSQYDLVMIECEHQGFDSLLLRSSLQYLLNRRAIAAQGLLARPAPLVRVPFNTRETSEWIVKQCLDAGAMGLILPHLDSVEGAAAAVRAARYPSPRESALQDPGGMRGWSPDVAANYWGIGVEEYYARADVWPLNPDGEILLMGIVESVQGIRNLPDILKEVRGIGAVWAGVGDLSVSMGLKGQYGHPEVEREVLNILHICREHGVACAATISPTASAEQRIEQGFQIVLIPTMYSTAYLDAVLAGRGKKA